MSFDEGIRREQRDAIAGAPSRRRLVELGRLGAALSAMLPTNEELEGFVGAYYERMDVGTLVALRAYFRKNDRPPRPVVVLDSYYGRPTWYERQLGEPFVIDVRHGLAERGRPPQIDLLPVVVERPGRFSGSSLRERRISDPNTAPARSTLHLEDALRTIPIPRHRRRR